MDQVLKREVLVLNQSWIPINIKSVFHALCTVFKGKAQIVGKDYRLYDFDSWVDTWEDAIELSKIAEEDVIHSINCNIKVPEVIRVKKYNGFLVKYPKLTRSAIFKRDNYTCQYCGKTLSSKYLNIDHVIPKSRGGKNSWTNLVLSCIRCNDQKGARTPKEAGMILLKKPAKPHWTLLKSNVLHKNMPKSWEDFLGKMYWNAELKDD